MPFAGMGIPFQAVVFGYKRFIHRRFGGSFFLADGDGYDSHVHNVPTTFDQ
jgi:hypothetical protein